MQGIVPAYVDTSQTDEAFDLSVAKISPADIANLVVGLDPRSHWDKNSDSWGKEDGTRVDVRWVSGFAFSIFVRLDVRGMSHSFLGRLEEFGRLHGLMIITERHEVLPPAARSILGAVRSSTAYEFVNDPSGFLRRLDDSKFL